MKIRQILQAESIRLLHQVSHQSSTGSNTVLHIDNRLDGEELAELKNKEQLETFIDRTNPQEIVYKNRIQINKFLENLDLFSAIVIFENNNIREELSGVKFVSKSPVSYFKKYSNGVVDLEIAGIVESLSIIDSSKTAVIVLRILITLMRNIFHF